MFTVFEIGPWVIEADAAETTNCVNSLVFSAGRRLTASEKFRQCPQSQGSGHDFSCLRGGFIMFTVFEIGPWVIEADAAETRKQYERVLVRLGTFHVLILYQQFTQYNCKIVQIFIKFTN
jgi:hypothetical protein